MNAATNHFAVNTYSYTMRYSAHETMNRLADRGHTAFELMMYPGHLWPADIDAVGRHKLHGLLAQRSLRLTTLNMPNVDINIAGATAEMRSYSLGILRAIIELAGDIGAPAVILGPGKANPLFPAPREQLESHFFAALDMLLPVAAKAGTAIYIENMPFAFLPGIRELMDAVNRYGDDTVGVVYDLANGYFIREDITEGLRQAAPRLRLVHVSDTGQTIYRHDPVGAGSVPFGVVPSVLKKIGYRELPVLEIISTDPDRDIAESVVDLDRMGWATAISVGNP